MLLADQLEARHSLGDVLPLGDDVLEIETLYNRTRPDVDLRDRARGCRVDRCGARPGARHHRPRDGDEPFSLAIDDLDACPRFIARVFRDVTIGESPAWLKGRLMGAGMRPISNVVDITNYVMLALGSPLHAYDADTLARRGSWCAVRQSKEVLVTLDGHDTEARPRRPGDRRPRAPDRPRRCDGRREHRGLRRHHVGRARDRELRAADGHPKRRAAPHALRVPDAVGEGRRPRGGRALGDLRVAAPCGAGRRALDGRDRVARRPCTACGDRLPPAVRERPRSGSRSPRTSSASGSPGSASR